MVFLKTAHDYCSARDPDGLASPNSLPPLLQGAGRQSCRRNHGESTKHLNNCNIDGNQALRFLVDIIARLFLLQEVIFLIILQCYN